MLNPPTKLPVQDAAHGGSVASGNGVRLIRPGAPTRQFGELRRVFPQGHFERLQSEGFHFYHTTFWYPLDRPPENVFESVVQSLRPLAHPSSKVIGVEWWFSVLLTNATPQWLLPWHFDRSDLAEKDAQRIRHPECASVLFMNSVPYGELVVTDQVLTDKGPGRGSRRTCSSSAPSAISTPCSRVIFTTASSAACGARSVQTSCASRWR